MLIAVATISLSIVKCVGRLLTFWVADVPAFVNLGRRYVATLVCFVFIVTSPILVSHALASVVAYVIAHTNFGSAQNGVFAVSRTRERIRFGCDVN